MNTNRREFMKVSAMAATTAVAGWLLPHNALAAAFDNINAAQSASVAGFTAGKAVSMEECQSLDYNQMAFRSPHGAGGLALS